MYDRIKPNFAGRLNRRKIAAEIADDMKKFYSQECDRMEYVKSQKDILDNEEYEKLKYKIAKDGLAEIKLINENWKTRLNFLQEESGKKHVRVMMVSVIIIPATALILFLYGKPNLSLLVALSLFLVIPRGNFKIDTFDLLLWNLYGKGE